MAVIKKGLVREVLDISLQSNSDTNNIELILLLFETTMQHQYNC